MKKKTGNKKTENNHSSFLEKKVSVKWILVAIIGVIALWGVLSWFNFQSELITGDVNFIVKNEMNQPISGAHVSISDPNQNADYEGTANAIGEVNFKAIRLTSSSENQHDIRIFIFAEGYNRLITTALAIGNGKTIVFSNNQFENEDNMFIYDDANRITIVLSKAS